MGTFSAKFKFSMTSSAKLLIGSKKVRWSMMAGTSSIIVQSLVELERRTSA